jgi:ankyrin repeat protein
MPSKILEAIYNGRTEELAVLIAAARSLTIFEAAALGDAVRIRALVKKTPSLVRDRSDDGWTALHLAAHFGQADAVDALLASGADVHAWSENKIHNQPLHAAMAGRGNFRILTSLLSKGADVNVAANSGYRPLHLAAARPEPALVETLLARGADAAALTDDGKTALAIAEGRGDPRVARRLRGEQP